MLFVEQRIKLIVSLLQPKSVKKGTKIAQTWLEQRKAATTHRK